MNLEGLMERAANSIITRLTSLRKTPKVLIICGNHNITFAWCLMRECYAGHASPHLWVWNEDSVKSKSGVVFQGVMDKLPDHTGSLLKSSDLVIWLTQFENPMNAMADLGVTVCSFWDKVYEATKDRPRLLVNLFSPESMRRMDIGYRKYVTTFASAVDVDYEKMKETGSAIQSSLEGRALIRVADPNGTNLSFSIENRRVSTEVGVPEEYLAAGKEGEVEVPAGEVYVAPLESSAFGRLVVDEVRDLGVRHLEMVFDKGKISDLTAGKGEARFRNLLENAEAGGDILAEFGIGINPAMKPIGLRILDEKALGTAHLAIGNNIHLGGVNKASIHLDLNLYRPTIRADADFIMKDGLIILDRPRH